MNTLALWAANKAVRAAGLAIGVPTAVRADGLDGFAIGALMSSACFLVVTSSRKPGRALFARRERAPAPAGAHPRPPPRTPTRPPRAQGAPVLHPPSAPPRRP